MGSFLQEVKGFTPVIDVLARTVGWTTAAVYGVAWRYCQMQDGVCKAAQETIADHLGVCADTVKAHLDKLCKNGYLEDLTPGLQGRPHVYKDTGKVKIIGLLAVEMPEISVTDTENLGNQIPKKSVTDTENLGIRIVLRENTGNDEEKKRFALFLETVKPVVAAQTYSAYVRFLNMVDGSNGVLRVTAPAGPLDVCRSRLAKPLERAAQSSGWTGIEFVSEEA